MAKPLRFVGSSLDDLRNFPDEVRRGAGSEEEPQNKPPGH